MQQEIIERLIAVKTEIDEIRETIEEDYDVDEDGEDPILLTSGLWNLRANIDETIGALFVHAHRKGELTFFGGKQ